MDKLKFDLLGPAQAWRQAGAHQLHQQISKSDPRADAALLEMFATADSSLLLGHKPKSETSEQDSAPVHLILDDTRRDAAAIIGTDELLWRDPISQQTKPTWHTESQRPTTLIGLETSVPEPETMSASELKLYWRAYFNDPTALDEIIALFTAHRQTDLNELLSVNLEPEPEAEAPLNNLHSVGLAAPKQRKLAFKRAALEQAVRDQVRAWLDQTPTSPDQAHQNQLRGLHRRSALRNSIEHRLKGTTGEVIQFPKAFTPPRAVDEPTETNSERQYHHETVERIGPMFLGMAHYLAHLPENLNWFCGLNQALYVPPELNAQYQRLCQAESACHTFRYSAQLESTVAALISYHYPRLVSADSKAQARRIHKNEAQYYQPPEATFEKAETPPMKTFTLNPELAAQHFKSPDGLAVELTLEQIEQVWQLPDSQLITFTINGQARSLTAEVFRRWFHYQSNPVVNAGNTGYLKG